MHRFEDLLRLEEHPALVHNETQTGLRTYLPRNHENGTTISANDGVAKSIDNDANEEEQALLLTESQHSLNSLNHR